MKILRGMPGLRAACPCLVWATYVLWAKQAVNTPANENREEQSNMTTEKVIMLIEAKIQRQRRVELMTRYANTCRWRGGAAPGPSAIAADFQHLCRF
jgi:hypothetical protein